MPRFRRYIFAVMRSPRRRYSSRFSVSSSSCSRAAILRRRRSRAVFAVRVRSAAAAAQIFLLILFAVKRIQKLAERRKPVSSAY